MTAALLAISGVGLAGAGAFALAGRREGEARAARAGLILMGIFVLAGVLAAAWPESRPVLAACYGLGVLYGLLLLIPLRRRSRGTADLIEGLAERFDERDTVFARNRSLPPDSEAYRIYYAAHPERESSDAERRAMGTEIGLSPGRIDGGAPVNVAMTGAAFSIPPLFGPVAVHGPEPGREPEPLSPERAAGIAKAYARHLGAAAVGICRVNPLWAYSNRGEIHYGNWEDWGRPIPDPLPYAVIFAVEMDHDLVSAAPHTPTMVESAVSYARGAWIGTILATWIAGLGYRAEADHSRHYSMLMVPLAVDAGLGELGRHGYLIADRLGPRVRLFAVTTDMPLAVDPPADLGVEAFCRVCRKCAVSCPSRSIPRSAPEVVNGVRKWPLDAESCYTYWARAGSDCSVCMAVCPFSRPDTPLHRTVRWFLKRSPLARWTFPHIDNLLYGRRWKPKPPPPWVDGRAAA